MTNEQIAVENLTLESRPGVLMVGSPNVGKRTLLSRLVSVASEDVLDSSLDILGQAWTIDTKYYTADVSVWVAHLHEDFSITTLPICSQLAALVMVFDTNDLSSLAALKDWVSRTDIQKFDILLCIGNKVDLLPGHSAHVEYRRLLQKNWTSFDTDLEYGLSESEGVGLLGDEESPSAVKMACLEWCTEHNIEYIEACASNPDFDRCLSVDGDLQGFDRLYGALSAHMWPGMVMKSGDKITHPSLPENEDLSEEESDYEFEYEVLSAGSAEEWDDTDGGWVSADGSIAGCSYSQKVENDQCDGDSRITSTEGEHQPSTSGSRSTKEISGEIPPDAPNPVKPSEPGGGTQYDFEDLDQLMSEIGNVRDSLRLMPDFQRREMAANLALKMAAMFEDSSGDDEEADVEPRDGKMFQ